MKMFKDNSSGITQKMENIDKALEGVNELKNQDKILKRYIREQYNCKMEPNSKKIKKQSRFSKEEIGNNLIKKNKNIIVKNILEKLYKRYPDLIKQANKNVKEQNEDNKNILNCNSNISTIKKTDGNIYDKESSLENSIIQIIECMDNKKKIYNNFAKEDKDIFVKNLFKKLKEFHSDLIKQANKNVKEQNERHKIFNKQYKNNNFKTKSKRCKKNGNKNEMINGIINHECYNKIGVNNEPKINYKKNDKKNNPRPIILQSNFPTLQYMMDVKYRKKPILTGKNNTKNKKKPQYKRPTEDYAFITATNRYDGTKKILNRVENNGKYYQFSKENFK